MSPGRTIYKSLKMSIYIYHYRKCKKSRAALDYLTGMKIHPEVIHYVEEGITPEKLEELAIKLKIKPSDMVRRQEEYYKENLKDRYIIEEEWLQILADYPKLLKRPIVVMDNKAVIADPPQLSEQVLTDNIEK